MLPSISFHPNTRLAYKIVFGTLVTVFAVVALMNLPTHVADDIVFSQQDGADFEVMVMAADGSELRQLTNNDADDWGAVWTADQSQIVFHSDRDGNYGIYRMNADGSDVVRLTPMDWVARFPTVSNQGQIAFHALVNDNWDLYMVELDGSDLVRLTYDGAADFGPAFSPDGSKIAFHTLRNGRENIMVLNLDEWCNERLTMLSSDSNHIDVWPSWSPDGERIVFHSERDGESEIYTMAADGSDVRQLTNNNVIDRVARFSPDGERVVFRSERNGDSEIFSMALDGSDVQQLTSDALMNYHPDW